MQLPRLFLLGPTVAAAILLGGCAGAPYQEDSIARELMLVNLGGHRTTQLDDARFRVEYSASPPTPDETIVKYIRYRCSTLALEKGFDGFAYEVPITMSPPRPSTKKHFYTRVVLRKKPFSTDSGVVDARATRDELDAFIKARS